MVTGQLVGLSLSVGRSVGQVQSAKFVCLFASRISTLLLPLSTNE